MIHTIIQYRATVTIVQFQVVVAALLLPQFFFLNNQYQPWTTPHKSVGELTSTKQNRTKREDKIKTKNNNNNNKHTHG